MVHVEYVVWDELMLTLDSSQRAQVLHYMCVYIHTDTDRQIDKQGKRERERDYMWSRFCLECARMWRGREK